ncbi:DUF1202 family protein [Pseudocitrobacter vendiensis]|uniref:DUF1202 domain-containing protein n=1 Tax=Pseudocitrobacter vendiensis TaxID=2488306 RepID=A0ABM9F8X1_9ENTR|nr:DUF1202 family protein [Pseudocitrobacter vendiensis]CAH6637294.1 DUF1202 domain-containing protein [Pseudocitrobacter vendiensis]
MKLAWKSAALLLCCFAAHVLADDNTPTDDVIKQQFAKQSDGLIRMGDITLQQIEKVGNRATYTIEGDIIATDNLYAVVGIAGDYTFYERTWTKDQPVKFSAMMTAVGTKASSWSTEFYSMQAAAKRIGRPFSKNENLSKSLIVNDSGFMAQFAKLDAQFADSKASVEKQQKQYKALSQQIEALDEQINKAWGTDSNGKPLGRDAVLRAKRAEVYDVDSKNDMNKFINQYYIKVYEPALIACQKKGNCDTTSINAARDKAQEEKSAEYARQHDAISTKVKAEIEALEKKVEPLTKKREALRGQMVVLESSNYELTSDAKLWAEGVERLRKEGVIR